MIAIIKSYLIDFLNQPSTYALNHALEFNGNFPRNGRIGMKSIITFRG
jgi:hypothetical protein